MSGSPGFQRSESPQHRSGAHDRRGPSSNTLRLRAAPRNPDAADLRSFLAGHVAGRRDGRLRGKCRRTPAIVAARVERRGRPAVEGNGQSADALLVARQPIDWFRRQRSAQANRPRGRTVRRLANAPLFLGGSWNTDGTIVFVPNTTSAVFRVSDTGGDPVAVTPIQRLTSHHFPRMLPDGRHFLDTPPPAGGPESRESTSGRSTEPPPRHLLPPTRLQRTRRPVISSSFDRAPCWLNASTLTGRN